MKKALLVEGAGGPLAAEVAAANVPDAKLLEATLDAVVLERPPVEVPDWPQHLSLDAAFDDDASYLACLDRDYTPHIARLHRWRGILIRWERKAANYRGLLQFACALLWFRRLHRLTSGSPQRYVR